MQNFFIFNHCFKSMICKIQIILTVIPDKIPSVSSVLYHKLFLNKLIRMIKKILAKAWPLILITIIIFIFQARLFFPHLSTYTTPDFGRTDVLHIGLPDKLIESESLRSLQLPLWNNHIGFGYATLSESFGFYYIPNLIIFALFPFNFAVPTMFLATFIVAAFSMYYLIISLGMEKRSALFGAITYVFSAAMILRVSHIPVLQSISLVPLAITFNLQFLKAKSLKTSLLLSIVLSQILVTFAQTYVYFVSLILFLNILYLFFTKKGHLLKLLLFYFVLIIWTLVLSSAQIFATAQAINFSVRNGGLDPNSILSDFPYQPKNFLTFLNPFIVGNPEKGTYNSFDWRANGIFWENTAYIGILPLILFIVSITIILRTKKKNVYYFILITTAFSTLLAAGKLAPLYVLFSVPPLNFFRVPARFIMFTQVFMIIIATYGLNILFKKYRILNKYFFIFFLLLIIDFYINWWFYHPIASLKSIEATPSLINNLDTKDLQNTKFYSINTGSPWNDIFTKYGWYNKLDYYNFFYNALEPNLSIFYGINHIESYQVLPTRRQALLQSSIFNNLNIDSSIKPNELSKKTMSFASVKYLVTTKPIDDVDFNKVNEVEKDKYKFYLYEYTKFTPIFRIYYKTQNIHTIEDYTKIMSIKNANTAMVEDFDKEVEEGGTNSINQIQNTNGYVNLKVSSTKPGVLVFSDSYYPGWKAKINGQETKIYGANINSKAIYIPQGENNVEFIFDNAKIKAGILISLISYIITIFLLFSKKFDQKISKLL